VDAIAADNLPDVSKKSDSAGMISFRSEAGIVDFFDLDTRAIFF
jgi:hypothetical protein